MAQTHAVASQPGASLNKRVLTANNGPNSGPLHGIGSLESARLCARDSLAAVSTSLAT